MASAEGSRAAIWIAVAGLIVAAIGVVVTATVPEVREMVGLEDADAPPRCGERLTDDPSPPTDDSSRVRPPYAFEVTFQRSTRLDGRAAARVEWAHTDPVIQSGLLAISGRRGEADPADSPMRLNDDLPPPGTCGKWNRGYERETPEQSHWTVIIEGLWAGETYCFAVNAADEDGGITGPYPSINTEAICRRVSWPDSWGEPEQPPA